MRACTIAMCWALALPLLAQSPAPAPVTAPAAAGQTVQQIVDRVIGQEHQFAQRVIAYQPRVETYLQQLKVDRDGVNTPAGDTYFLGFMDLRKGLNEPMFTTVGGSFFDAFRTRYDPRAFVQMIMPDRYKFNDTYYNFSYQGQDFLGDVRCLMFDVAPKPHAPPGSFKGRIWVEDQGYNIVRFDGTYVPDQMTHHFLHFDSWRTMMGPGYWLPTAIYTEEGFGDGKLLKAQTRFWGYSLSAGQSSELTDVQVESPAPVDDDSQTSHDTSPLGAQRKWEQKAEDDVLTRMQKSGMLSPPGPVDQVLEQVVNNIEITNKLDIEPPVRCRVMLTTPLESFTVGHTIVVSRGLIDVLPDEASLAMILAHELGSIVLNQGINTSYAFDDRMIFPDQDVFKKIRMKRSDADEEAADRKAVELLRNSPYAGQLSEAGLFLLAVTRQAAGMPNLLTAHMGNAMVLHGRLMLMQALIASAPQLRPRDPNQIPALPLGAHIRVNAWNDEIELMKAPAAPIISERDKLSFEVTPFNLYLTREATVANATDPPKSPGK